jgi:hypothetical protein
LHLVTAGKKWATKIAFLDSLPGCGFTPLTRNLVHHSYIKAYERMVC